MADKKAKSKKHSSGTTLGQKLKASVKTSADAPRLYLNDVELDLTEDNDTWSGNGSRDVSGGLTIEFKVGGLAGTDWDVEVDLDCDDGPVKVAEKQGTIGQPGGRGFKKTVQITNPCGA